MAMADRDLGESDVTCAEGFDEARYPPYAVTDAQRQRWRLAEGIAREIFADCGEMHAWAAARSLYRSDLPTDP